jgi:F0F1-type ATP synthase assembly protein I
VIRLFDKERNSQRRKQFRDIGIYTAIPMMMIVGPALGYYLGRLAEKKWGHEPWPSIVGCLFGLAASVRQIWLLLKQGSGKR